MSKKKKWILGGLGFLGIGVVALFVTASKLSKRFEPAIKEQVVRYLSERFDSEVEIGSLAIDIPRLPPIRLLFTQGRGVIAQITGTNVVVRHKARRDIPPMFVIGKFHFEADLGRVFDPEKRVAMVAIDAMEIHVPPRGGGQPGKTESRPLTKDLTVPDSDSGAGVDGNPEAIQNQVVLERVVITNSKLVILPKRKDRKPLEFELHRVALNSVRLKKSLQYEADLTNPKPPGSIRSTGWFGPWNTESPSETPLSGQYLFQNADLGVFPAIAGTLQSTGSFEGNLGAVQAKGEAQVPNFRLRMSGNQVPLHTRFDALIDGTNGNTVLKPVHATLGTTNFVTNGAVIKHEGDTKRTIELMVHIADGELMDLVRLATKGKPFISGRIQLDSSILIPPLQGKVGEKLILDGKFTIRRGLFQRDDVQGKIDSLSRRGQGQPKNEGIDDTFSDMAGSFHLENQVLKFSDLSFAVPGAGVQLAGSYDMGVDQLDFLGSLSLRAKVSQTMTGWKRWALKPLDPILAKNGAGTYLKIKVTGSSKDPSFGLRR